MNVFGNARRKRGKDRNRTQKDWNRNKFHEKIPTPKWSKHLRSCFAVVWGVFSVPSQRCLDLYRGQRDQKQSDNIQDRALRARWGSPGGVRFARGIGGLGMNINGFCMFLYVFVISFGTSVV